MVYSMGKNNLPVSLDDNRNDWLMRHYPVHETIFVEGYGAVEVDYTSMLYRDS